jgi:hypothetical protein
VAAEAADTVIILQPEPCSSKAAADALKATALVSLVCLRERALSQARAGARGLPSRMVVLLACALGAMQAGCRQAASRLWATQHAASSSASSMRIVVQVQSSAASSGSEDVISFLQGATASSRNSSEIQQVQLLSQSTLDRCVNIIMQTVLTGCSEHPWTAC